MRYDIYIKRCGDCDCLVTEVEDLPIPRVGESVDIWGENKYNNYIVSEVKYWIGKNRSGVEVFVKPVKEV